MERMMILGFSNSSFIAPARTFKGCFLLVVFIAFLATSGFMRDLRVGYYDNSPLSFTKEGQAFGVFPDLLSKIAQEEGWNLHYEKHVFAEGLEKIRSGELDVFVAVAETSQRAEWARFNDEVVIYNWGEVYTKPDLG
ncbi:MAG TPA: hypothetical protein DDY74_01005, partial [Pseudothermotoga sp.]|nr:hypothetical protein [Pseudothermotoga sp.]